MVSGIVPEQTGRSGSWNLKTNGETIEPKYVKMDRRNFIRQIGRYVLLSAMAALGVFGIHKRKKVPAADCILTGYCKTCTGLASCSLPEAVREKAMQ